MRESSDYTLTNLTRPSQLVIKSYTQHSPKGPKMEVYRHLTPTLEDRGCLGELVEAVGMAGGKFAMVNSCQLTAISYSCPGHLSLA